jgi:NAD(P)H-hydrate epimerase
MLLDTATCAALLPNRPADGHKGSFGTLVCVCGSLDYAGAALLCGLGAARAGVGLVVVAVPRSLQPVVAGRVPAGDIDARESGHALKTKSADALVIGCGLGETDGYRELLLGLIAREGPAMVIDGGALNLLARSARWWESSKRDCVLTPHPGEFQRLMGTAAGATDDERTSSATSAAQRFGQVVVLKGAHTVVAAPDGGVAVAPFANAALATAGSGDVLAGTIGSLLAQGLVPFDAARLGVWLHGRAGERVSERLGDSGLIASDLPYEIALERHDLAAQR